MMRRMQQQEEEPTYDYIAPCATASAAAPAGRNSKLTNNPQSVFVPIIPARNTWNQQQYPRHVGHPSSSSPLYHGDWNNQETLALSQRL
jgi:hypothetical protein